MNITIHSGGDCIGAACLEVASSKTRIVLDCGWPLEEEAERVPPRVPGLFGPGTPPDAVLLSHSHLDHTGFIAELGVKVRFTPRAPRARS